MGLTATFNVSLHCPLLTQRDAKVVLSQLETFEPHELDPAVAMLDHETPIKRLFMLLEMARHGAGLGRSPRERSRWSGGSRAWRTRGVEHAYALAHRPNPSVVLQKIHGFNLGVSRVYRRADPASAVGSVGFVSSNHSFELRERSGCDGESWARQGGVGTRLGGNPILHVPVPGSGGRVRGGRDGRSRTHQSGEHAHHRPVTETDRHRAHAHELSGKGRRKGGPGSVTRGGE